MVAAAQVTYGTSPRNRKRGILVIYADTFLMYGGFFMVIPLIAVHYVNELGWSASSIGFVLAIRQLVQQGLAFVGGVLADRYGAKGPIVAGLLVRAVGFLWMAAADTFVILFASAMLAAAGGALFESPKSAAGAALTSESERARFYAILGVVGNLGLTLGPLAGALLLQLDFAAVALAAGVCFVVAGVITWMYLPSVQVSTDQHAKLTSGLNLAIRDRTFVIFTVLLMGFWFMAVQYNISLPLIATDLTGSSSAAGIVLAVYAAVTVVLQYPLLRLAERWMTPLPILTIGTAIMAIALGLISLAEGMTGLILCSAVFAVGGVLAQPTQQAIMARLASPTAYGAYFSVGSYSIAIGGSTGNFFGGALYGWGEALEFGALPWLVFLTLGMLTTVGLWVFSRHHDQTRSPAAEHPDSAPSPPPR